MYYFLCSPKNFITIADSQSQNSWQLQFWYAIAITLESIMYQFQCKIEQFYRYSSQLELGQLAAIVLVYNRDKCRKYHVLIPMQALKIIITTAHSYRFNSWQLQFWYTIAISLKSIMYQFPCSNGNFITIARSYSYDSWQLQFWHTIAIRLESMMY